MRIAYGDLLTTGRNDLQTMINEPPFPTNGYRSQCSGT
jgi:hypothetical protein